MSLKLSSNANECKPLVGGRARGPRLAARQPSKAVQAAPIKPKLKVPGTKRLNPKGDGFLSSFAFNFNFRRYILGNQMQRWSNDRWSSTKHRVTNPPAGAGGRGLHSFTSQLNLSAIYGMGGARRGCVAHIKGV